MVLTVCLPSSVLAIADPDDPPAINVVYVYQDLLEDGDAGVLIDYFIDYTIAGIPTETITEAYLASFIDTDGTTVLRTVAPYAFSGTVYTDKGYGRGVIWVYFSADDVALLGLSSVNEALYRIWLFGNPTVASGWPGDPPKTIAALDEWYTTGDSHTLLALRILFYAQELEVIWGEDMIDSTSEGNKLTGTGEDYFTNVISSLRDMAPLAFSSVETTPDYTAADYLANVDAEVTSGTATVIGSPVILPAGDTVIDTGITTGTVIVTLSDWNTGTFTDLVGTATGSPVTLYPGVNTITVTAPGTFTVGIDTETTVTKLEDAVSGTGLDLTALATIFGMSRWFLSSIVWMFVTMVICFAIMRIRSRPGEANFGDNAGKVVLYAFAVCVVGGMLLGLLHPLVGALMFIACGGFIGFVLFFQSETVHKLVMFMAWMFLITSMAGGFVTGEVATTATYLTADITATEVATISVAGTDGFPDAGTIMIGDERISYPQKTATTFVDADIFGAVYNPIVRGDDGTSAVAHSEGAIVRTIESGVINATLDYKIARLFDDAGSLGFVTLPVKLLDVLLAFFTLPLDFLGTDMVILTVIWGVFGLGTIVALVVAMVGGRRV